MNDFAGQIYEHLNDDSLAEALQAIANQGNIMKATIEIEDWTVKGYLNGETGRETAVVSYKGIEVAEIGIDGNERIGFKATVDTPYPEISAPICDAVQKAIGIETIDRTQQEIVLAADAQKDNKPYKMYISETGKLRMTEVSQMTENGPSGEKQIQHGDKPEKRTCVMEFKEGQIDVMPGYEDVQKAIEDAMADRQLQRNGKTVIPPTIPPVSIPVFYTQEAGDKNNALPGHDTHIRVPDFQIEAGKFTELRSDNPNMRLIADSKGTCTLFVQSGDDVKRIPFVSAKEAVQYMAESTHVVTNGAKIGDIIGTDKDGQSTDLTLEHRKTYYIREIEKPTATRDVGGHTIPASGRLDPEPNKEKPVDKLSMFVHGDVLHKVLLESMDSNGRAFDIPYEVNIQPNGLLSQMTIQDGSHKVATVDIARIPITKSEDSLDTNGAGVIQIKEIHFEPNVDAATQRKITRDVVDSIGMHNQTRYQVPVEETYRQAEKILPQTKESKGKPSKDDIVR